MNTPPKRKRHQKPPALQFGKDSLFVGMIDDVEVNKQFSRVMTSFVYLEERMASVLAVLLGASDKIAASYIMRAIKSPTGRIDIMKDLLEKAPINSELGDEYDQVIREFRTISSQRNEYAHGKWWTDFRSNEIVLDETDDPMAALHVRRVVTAAELEDLNKRMLQLHKAIASGPEAELEKRRERIRRQRTAPKASKSPRQISRK
jgi:hypothetical protein